MESTSAASVVDSLGLAVLGVDVDGRVAFANDAVEQLLGRSRARLSRAPVAALGEGGAKVAGLVATVLSGGSPRRETVDTWGEVTVEPWWSAATCVGAVVSMRPVREDRASQSLPLLAAGLAHEIRNPLAALRGAAELLSLESDPADRAEYVGLVLRESARVDALVKRLLDLARPPTLVSSAMAPSALVHDLALQGRAFAAALGRPVEVRESYDPALPALDADRSRLLDALGHLVKNAVEAAAGRVEVTAAFEVERRRIDGGRARRMMRLSVIDDGAGIGHGAKPFTPFFTTKPQGSGLGLVTAREVVEAHGGRLELRPAHAVGTEALVLLPLGEAS
ncbi:MAG: hypothetical protein RL199_1818 [Pseudomonadota bacterium]|jgi:two-component system nitrogen regulation sensor histidine kinase GlnL